MERNPYAAPLSRDGVGELALNADRQRALKGYRMMCLVLLAPALFNFYVFDFQVATSRLPERIQTLYRGTNLFLFALTAMLIWFLGFPLIESIAKWIRKLLARHVSLERWMNVLYQSSGRAFYLSMMGAAIWALWVFAVYYLEIRFGIATFTANTLGHLLGAAWYLPLLWNWFRVSRVT